jgi:hypothetical protein
MPKKLTKEEFIDKAVAIHGSAYDYSKVEYINAMTPVLMVCKIHGEFMQTPDRHLRQKSGCQKCGALRSRPIMSTEEFIRRSEKKHGLGKYDYRKTNYLYSTEKVIIICNIHGEFLQTPSAHLWGIGCYKCGRDRTRYSQEEFVAKAREIHVKENYDYSKTVYNGMHVKVAIICSEHGEFWQIPNNHLKGAKCPKCSLYRRTSEYRRTSDGLNSGGSGNFYNPKDFFEKCRIIHDNKYDYSQSIFTRITDKIRVICPIHGEYFTEANTHMRGSGCRKCMFESRRIPVDKFIERSKKIHGEKYDYSKIYSSYKSLESKILIVCSIHGEFWQKAELHANGGGCQRCGIVCGSKKTRLTQEEFIFRAREIHGNKFDYSEVKYITNRDKVKIFCKLHGFFTQKPNDHLLGRGCPQCHVSFGEKCIRKWLLEHNLNFNPQYSYKDLTGFSGRSLSFDFYVINHNLLIEYDGEQHFRPVQFYGISLERATINFKKTQYHDSLKNEYCKNNNIPLLRISYQDKKKIPEILNHTLIESFSDREWLKQA